MRPILFFLITLFTCSAGAQSMIEETIHKAMDEYDAGHLEEVINLLTPYAYSYSENKSNRKTVLKILTETYLFLDENKAAEKIYLELLRIDPFYKLNASVPEMKYLKDRIETYPLSTYRIYGGVHLFSEPILKKQISPTGVTIDQYNYDLDSIATPIGSFVSITGAYKLPNSNWDLSLGYTNSTQYYYYNATLSGVMDPEGNPSVANLHFFEKQRWSKLSVGLSHQFIKRDKVIHRNFFTFISAQISYDILHKGQNFINDLNIKYGNDNSISLPPFKANELRNKSNISLQLELGARIHANRYFVEFGIQYDRFFRLIPNPDQRNSQPELVETFHYLDDDFTFHNLGLFLGTGVYFFNSKTKRFIDL